MRKTSLDSVYQLAKKDDRVVFIGSDLGAGVLDDMKKEIPLEKGSEIIVDAEGDSIVFHTGVSASD